MPRSIRLTLRGLLMLSPLVLSPAFAAGPPDAAALQAAQREALAPLSAFEGTWRGPATVVAPDGQAMELVQTERVGPMLGNTLRLIEGRGHRADGTLAFNALAVVSFNPQSGKYNFRSYAQGHEGDFPLEVRAGEFVWTIQAGPAVIRYAASVKDGVWTEVGERTLPGQAPVKIFEMRLQRVGKTDWPAAGALAP
ncbi:MAG: DUF1579 domain-containing protein [Burkholderiaceae bacterium]